MPHSANPKQIYPRPAKREYVPKSPEATARRQLAAKRNWDVMQLTNIVGQLRKLESNLYNKEQYKHRFDQGAAHSGTRAALSLATDFAEKALVAIKAHNKDPKENPLP
jgi:hypothetical protein